MKISSLLETPTTSVGTNDTQAPRFGRSNEMLEAESNTSNPTDMTGRTCEKCKEGDYQETSQHDDMDGVLHCTKCNNKTKRWKNYKEQVGESTTSGSVASVAAPLGGVQKRGQGSMFAGIKTSKKSPNSEGVAETSNPAQQAAIAISKKKKQGVAETAIPSNKLFVKKISSEQVVKESDGMFSKVMTHETTPEAAQQIYQHGFKKSYTGTFFNVKGQNYSGGGYGGTVIQAKITGPVDDILNFDDEETEELEFDDDEEIAEFARSEGYWAWTDGAMFVVLDPRHIQVIKQGVAEEQINEKSKSQAQFRMMAAVAHNPKFAKKVGISKKVGKEFHSADKKSDYKSLPKKVDEAEFTEDKLANQLYRDLQIFKKGSDKDIGSKAKDKDIGTKPTDKEVHNKKTKATSKKLNK